VKLHRLVLPLASVTVQVTGVVPLAKVEPLEGTQTKPAPGQLSFTTGANATAWLHAPGAVLVTILSGQAMVGGSRSRTVTVKLKLAVLPEVSVAVQLTVFVPLAKALPLVGAQVTVTPGQLSVAIGASNATIWLH